MVVFVIVMMVVYISGNQTRNKVGNTQPNVYSSQSFKQGCWRNKIWIHVYVMYVPQGKIMPWRYFTGIIKTHTRRIWNKISKFYAGTRRIVCKTIQVLLYFYFITCYEKRRWWWRWWWCYDPGKLKDNNVRYSFWNK